VDRASLSEGAIKLLAKQIEWKV